MKVPDELNDHLAANSKFSTGKPVTFSFLKNTEKASKMRALYENTQTFDQDIEPAGFYCLYTDGNHLVLPNWIEGTASVKSPLVIKAEGWKKLLNEIFKAKKKALTSKLQKAGFDAIVPIEGNAPMEIILLQPDTQIHKGE